MTIPRLCGKNPFLFKKLLYQLYTDDINPIVREGRRSLVRKVLRNARANIFAANHRFDIAFGFELKNDQR